MWDALSLDVRHSIRSLRRAPTFSLIVIVTLTLAVGATTAVGSLLNALVFRTLAVPSPEQLVALLQSDRRVFAVLPADRYDESKGKYGVETCVVARHQTGDIKLRSLLERWAPPEVLVITNRCPP